MLLLWREASRGYKKYPNVTKALKEQTIKAADAGHTNQQRKQDGDSTLITKGISIITRKSTPRKGTTFAEVKEGGGGGGGGG